MSTLSVQVGKRIKELREVKFHDRINLWIYFLLKFKMFIEMLKKLHFPKFNMNLEGVF